MSYELVFREETLQDISDSMDWYENQQEGLSDRFYLQLDNKLQKIAKDPFHYSIRYEAVHCAQMDKFPYLIHYIVEENRSRIVILGIIHTSRDPRTAEKRWSE